jgi:hypothetical protein
MVRGVCWVLVIITCPDGIWGVPGYRYYFASMVLGVCWVLDFIICFDGTGHVLGSGFHYLLR